MQTRRHDSWLPWWARLVTLLAVLVLTPFTTVRADSWNDRTTLTFSGPVRVPGTVLPAGEYEFSLMDLKANRHLVEIRRIDDPTVVAVVNAIPIKRQDAKGTTVLTFAPTVAGSPPAMKAWFYPGSLYGHEFIYPGDEAGQIASREKTIVLSEDRAAGDAAGGSIQLLDADGRRTPWRADEAVTREWATWTSGASASARARTATVDAPTEEGRDAAAPMVDSVGNAMRVSLDDLEDRPQRYVGQRISVDGEIEKVLGPRLFTIDEASWADLDGEMLVHVPTALAALVRPDDRVTITGTVRAFADMRLDDEWQWFEDGHDPSSGWATRHVLVATHVTGGDDDRAMMITRESVARAGKNVNSAQRPLASLDAVTADAVGREVELARVEVGRVLPGRGFFVSAGDRTLFVRPAKGTMPNVTRGEMVAIDGFVLTLPAGVKDDVFGEEGTGARQYLFATSVS